MHVMIIPSWHDVDYTDQNHTFFHNFVSFLSEREELEMGMIYIESSHRPQKKELISKENLPYHYLGMKSFGLPKRSVMWNRFFRNYLGLYDSYVEKHGKPDLIHAHSIVALIASSYISEKRAVKYFYTEHLGELKKQNHLRPELYKKAQKAVLHAEKCSSVSPGMCDFLEVYYGKEFIYIPNMIDTSLFYPKARVTDEPQFIMIGEPVDVKGIDVLLKAWKIVLKEMPTATLIFLDEIRDRHILDPFIEDNNLGHSLKFVGVVAPKLVAEYLRKSAVLISASRHESFGMSIAEAALCGTPVVATKTDGALSIVRPEIGSLVEIEDSIGLALAIIHLYKNRNDYSPEKLHQIASSHYDKEHVGKLWSALYRNNRERL